MTFYLLPNTGGDLATAVSVDTGNPDLVAGYDASDLIAGPRSTYARYEAATGGGNIFYDVAASTDFTHLVITRADWLLTEAGLRIRPMRHDGSAVDIIAGHDFNPLVASDLLGPTSQDLVMAFDISAETDNYGIGLNYTKTGGAVEAVQVSKIFGSVGFHFGQNPDLLPAPQWQLITPSVTSLMFTTMRGYEPVEVERRIVITWSGISVAKLTEFKALPNILSWPLYLYDDAGDLWTHKLEHVVIEGWEEISTGFDSRDIAITFLRLKHYV